jgi:hypothetical protein
MDEYGYIPGRKKDLAQKEIVYPVTKASHEGL